MTYAAATLWHLGYPDQALQKMNEGVALAQWLSDPFSLAFAQLGIGVVRQLRREALAVQDRSETLMALCAEHGLIQYSYYRSFLEGWALAEQGRKKEGIALIEEGLASSAIGDELNRPYFLVLLAETCRETFQLNVISRTGVVFQGPVREVTAVSADFEFGVFPDHVNFVTSLVSGTITLKLGDGSTNKYRLTGGRAEVKDGAMTVLASGTVTAVDPDSAATELQITEQKFAQMSFYDPGYQGARDALRVARVRAKIDRLRRTH